MSTPEVVEHISEKPWSDYTEADYSIEQWHAACLVHLHDGPPTSKSQCKLPVKTPNGAVNRNGVHAAAAALSGARSPLKASPEQKSKAASALRRLYSQLGETPPDSLKQSAMVEDFFEHHGVKGMKWGVRTKRVASAATGLTFPKEARGRRIGTNKGSKKKAGPQEVVVTDKRKRIKTSGGKGHPASAEAVRARTSGQIAKKSGVKALSNAELEAYNRRLNLEQNTKRLMYEDSSAPVKFVKTILRQTGKTQAQDAANQVASHQVKKALKKAALVAA